MLGLGDGWKSGDYTLVLTTVIIEIGDDIVFIHSKKVLITPLSECVTKVHADTFIVTIKIKVCS